MGRLCAAREDPEFTRQCEKLSIDIRRLDDARRGVDWAVSQNPEYYPEIPGSKLGLRMATVGPMDDMPLLRLYYKITIEHGETYVDWLRIEVVELDPDDPDLG